MQKVLWYVHPYKKIFEQQRQPSFDLESDQVPNRAEPNIVALHNRKGKPKEPFYRFQSFATTATIPPENVSRWDPDQFTHESRICFPHDSSRHKTSLRVSYALLEEITCQSNTQCQSMLNDKWINASLSHHSMFIQCKQRAHVRTAHT